MKLWLEGNRKWQRKNQLKEWENPKCLRG
jgi:hypothetical protein